MGYFSEQSIIEETQFEDRSYPSFGSQLLWRLDDLNDLYAELVELDAPCYGEDRYTNDDYRYAPVECFETLADVARAIEVVKAELEYNCEIVIEDEEDAFNEIFEDTTNLSQLKMFGDIYVCIFPMPQLVAQENRNVLKNFHKTY